MSKPELWLIAGPNGAGKSTIVGRSRHLLSHIVPNVPFINPDEHARQILLTRGRHGFADSPLMEQKAAFIEAAVALEKYIGEVLESGGTVGVETVLSTAKYQRFVELVLRKRGVFGLIYVALNSPSLASSASPIGSRMADMMCRNQKSTTDGIVPSRTSRGFSAAPRSHSFSTTAARQTSCRPSWRANMAAFSMPASISHFQNYGRRWRRQLEMMFAAEFTSEAAHAH